jgi:hypothetical protein
MKHILSLRTVVLGLALLFASISVVAAERAFSATGNGLATFITDEAGNVVGANVSGSGNGTHLGLFTTAGKINFIPDPNNPIIVHPTGEASFTAANGDKLIVVVEDGSMDVTTGIGIGHFRFAGGTGRFTNASGITEYVVIQNLVTGAFEMTIVGRIDF